MTVHWPTSDPDPVRRLHALAAGVRGARVTERVIDAPLATVWPLVADLEGEFGRIVTDMARVRVVGRDGDRLEAVARSRFGPRARFDGVLRPGWCWLQSRFLLIGIAATEAPDGLTTTVAFTGGVRLPGRAALLPLGVRAEGRRSLARLAERTAAAARPEG
ncbi:hypothetical protein AB0M29_07605 [Streptomyces sp. NPDC051976]|uniref:hypothetical protein n=1 Tax=Streptomyces sp. NPDC051976 TaxID=3154947 RepID=UPI003431C051